MKPIALHVEAWLTLLWVRLVIRLRPKTTLRKALSERGHAWLRSNPVEPSVVGATVVEVAQRHVVRMTCLIRSVAIKRMLERRGLEPELQIGFLRDERTLHGHAWVELNAVVIGDSAEVATRFDLRPSHEAWSLADSYDGFIWRFDQE